MIPSLRILLCAAGAAAVLSSPGFATDLTVNIDASSQGGAVSGSFCGASFETGSLLPNNGGVSGYLFSTSRTSLINLFNNMELKSLRVGGGSADAANTAIPGITSTDGWTGVDNLFSFAGQVSGLKLIYGLRMLSSSTAGNTAANNQANDETIAAHISGAGNAGLVAAFAIGNEPDWANPYHNGGDPNEYQFPSGTSPEPWVAYTTYRTDWKNFAAAVNSGLSGCSFVGPDTGDYNDTSVTKYTLLTGSPYTSSDVSWTEAFIDDKKRSTGGGSIPYPVLAGSQHYYVGNQFGNSTPTTASAAIGNMLSTGWVTSNYPTMFGAVLDRVANADGWHFRYTEANDYTGGVDGASNAFASALWALDFMCWQATNSSQCLGVNFHCKQDSTVSAQFIPTSVIYHDATSNTYKAYPKAAAIKMFALGSQGKGNIITGASVTKSPSTLNVTAYVVGTATDLYVTIVNKTHVSGSTVDAVCAINPTNFGTGTTHHAEYIVMASSPTTNDVTQPDATVGGAHINNTAGFSGSWTSLSTTGGTDGDCTLTVNHASAAIVHIWHD